MKYALPIVSAWFLLCTYWQLNDAVQYSNQDSWFWVIFYVVASAMTYFHKKKPLPLWSFTSVIGFSLGAALFRMQDHLGNFDFMTPFRATPIPSQMTASIQGPNETAGLFMVGLWFLFLAIYSTQQEKKKHPAA